MKIHLYYVGQFKGKSPYGTFWVGNVIRVHKGPTHFPQLRWPYEWVCWFLESYWHDKVFYTSRLKSLFWFKQLLHKFHISSECSFRVLVRMKWFDFIFLGVIFAITHQLMILVERLNSIGFLEYGARIFEIMFLLLFNRHRTYFRIFIELFPLRTWLTIVCNLWFLPN